MFLKVEKQDKENKIVEVKMNVPGDDFVKKNNVNFEEAVEFGRIFREIVSKKEKKNKNTHLK
jgi:putative sigma-54 modulation protein